MTTGGPRAARCRSGTDVQSGRPVFTTAGARVDGLPMRMPGPSARDQRGFTLIELVVSLLASLAVLGGTLTVVLAAVRAEATNSNRGVKVEQLDVALERFTRDARQATSAAYVAGSAGRAVVMQFLAPAPSVTWDCRLSANTACGRQVGAGTAARAATQIQNSDVLRLACRDANGEPVQMTPDVAPPAACGGRPATSVDVRLVAGVNCDGESRATCRNRTVTLRGGVSLRNAG